MTALQDSGRKINPEADDLDRALMIKPKPLILDELTPGLGSVILKPLSNSMETLR